MAEIMNHPLMFTLRDTISGNGFLVGITVSGRALMRKEEDDKWWMYGVRPGALAESGGTPQEAFLRFRNRYKEVLFDLAEAQTTFEDFKTEVERFFYEPDYEEEQLWEDALKTIRTGHLSPPEPFANVPRESPETRPSQITVERLDGVNKRLRPSDNVPDTFSLPKAA